MTDPSAIELRAVNKRYGAVSVLADIHLRIAPGEFCVFVGPSGCGKSTLLPVHDDVVAWTRGQGDGAIVCIFNLSPRDARYALPSLEVEALEGHGFAAVIERGTDGVAQCVLPPNGAFFGRVLADLPATRSLP